MDLWRPIAKHFMFPLHSMWERNSIPRNLQRMEKSQWWPTEKLSELRLDRLKRLLIHAGTNCPFYTRRFAECGFTPSKVQDFGDLAVIPLLTKDDIRNHREELVAQNLPKNQLVPDKTGGSTGQPLNFYMDRERIYSRNAAELRHNRWSGWDIGHLSAYFWGHRRDMAAPASLLSKLRIKYLDRYFILDTSSLTTQRMNNFRRELLRRKPFLYVAYANSMYLYAKYLRDSCARDYHRPQGIVTSAEMLDPERRVVIEEVFGCPVLNRYGSRETGLIASQCDKEAGLHICAETIHLEFLRGGTPVSAGEPGRIVVTDLLNHGMPLIRYDIRDVGIPSATSCDCGRNLPTMDVSAGRVTDFLVAPDGRLVSGASLTIYLIAKAPGVAQAQIVQNKRDTIILRVVKGEGFGTATREFFQQEIPRFFGEIKWTLQVVEEIPNDPSGKYRFSISNIDPAEIF